ncbi:hypothetical protein CO180_03220, partial [candidate division WWE3 bacterium CG_4_9_14_3_um_filter_41_6]
MLRNVITLVRMYQWPKNFLVFAALIFSQRLSDQHAVYVTFLALIAFCFIASASYIINDIFDLESDRKHPLKKSRPLASGAISISLGFFIAGVLAVLGFGIGYYVGFEFLLVLFAYAVLTNSYSYALKHIELIDILVVSMGFVLRAIAGGVAIGVTISNWLFV